MAAAGHSISSCFQHVHVTSMVSSKSCSLDLLLDNQNWYQVTKCDDVNLFPEKSVNTNEDNVVNVFFLGEYLDILAISCDSFDDETNQTIGRVQGKKSHIENLYKVQNWCREYRVAFKINSVINTFNVHEDMTEHIAGLNPVRWKVGNIDLKVKW